MKHWIAFIVILSSLLFTLFFPTPLQTCSYSPSTESYRYSMFQPPIEHLNSYRPFHFSSDFLNDGIPEMRKTGLQQNLKEWATYFNNQVALADIQAFLYDYELDTDDFFSKTLADIKAAPMHRFPLIQHLVKNKDLTTLTYLIFAKKMERFLKLGNTKTWEDTDAATKASYQKNIDLAKANYKQVDHKDLRLRYAYQMVVIARYLGDYQQAVQLFEQYVEPLQNNSVIPYWARLHYATALYHTNQAEKANYNFALVFHHAPSKRHRAYIGFERKYFEASLALAKTKEEQASVWLLYGVKHPGRALDIIKQLAQLTPDLPELELLVMREINKVEDWLLTPTYTGFSPTLKWLYNRKERAKARVLDLQYLEELTQFVQQYTNQHQGHTPAFWQVANAYLSFMQADYVQANQYLNQAEQAEGMTTALQNQIHLIRIMAFTNADNQISELAESSLVPALNWLKKEYPKLPAQEKIRANVQALGEVDKVWQALTARYLAAKQTDKAILCLAQIQDLTYSAQKEFIWHEYGDYFYFINEVATPEDVKQLLVLLNKKNPTNFEAFLMAGNKIKNDQNRLLDVLGTLYLRQDRLEKALAAFEQVPDVYWNKGPFEYSYFLAANPFYADFYSGHKPTKADTIRYTKTEFVRELLSLKAIADEGGADAAYCTFLLASGYFNMTFYGNSWMMVHFWATNAWGWRLTNNGAFADAANYYGCTQAEELYLKAAELANERHFAAMCYRLAGKCNYRKELFKNIMVRKDHNDQVPKFEDNPHYQHLKAAYPEYYDQLIDNCTTFEHFVALGD